MAATKDPDMRLIVDGMPLRARSAVRGVYTFDVPAGARQVTIASRSVVPAQVGGTDPRRLGVPVHRIALKGRGGESVKQIDLDHPRLTVGFHKNEGTHRWTNGQAVLPPDLLGQITDGAVIEVHIGTIDLDYPA